MKEINELKPVLFLANIYNYMENTTSFKQENRINQVYQIGTYIEQRLCNTDITRLNKFYSTYTKFNTLWKTYDSSIISNMQQNYIKLTQQHQT